MKYLVEKEKGKRITILDQIKWFRLHPTVKMIPDFDRVRKERMLKIQKAYPSDAQFDDLVLIGKTERVVLE